MNSAVAVYTIGHSNRAVHEFIAVLDSAGVETLVDVRAFPQSKRNVHFDREPLQAAIEESRRTYHWAGRQLGGFRKPSADSANIAIDPALRGYADHMQSAVFQNAVTQLIRLAARAPTAVMCAEKNAARCHRSVIADYLILHGHRVIHLMDTDSRYDHQLHAGARRESQHLVYDRQTQTTLDFKQGTAASK
ncbi:MAG: DUF488 domain-containing protein [Gammaproteobacteria bacterium]|nr:DUF488 domain-containing protein [Gammaproteobacteria bacterium]